MQGGREKNVGKNSWPAPRNSWGGSGSLAGYDPERCGTTLQSRVMLIRFRLAIGIALKLQIPTLIALPIFRADVVRDC